MPLRIPAMTYFARRSWLVPLVVAAAVVLGLAGTTSFVREWFAIDACLDGGGCWDRVAGRCEHEVQANCAR